MARTNGRFRSNRSPAGDTRRTCAYCGVEWYRSELVRDGANLLAGPCCQRGRDIVTLAIGNAEMASQRRIGEPRMASDGLIDGTPNETPPPLNWNGPPASVPNGGPSGPLSVLVNYWARPDVVQLDGVGNVQVWPNKTNQPIVPSQSVASRRPMPFPTAPALNNQPFLNFTSTQLQCLFAQYSLQAPLWIWGIAFEANWLSGLTLLNCGFGIQNGNIGELQLIRNAASTVNTGAVAGQWFRFIANFTVAGTDYLTVKGQTVTDAGAGQRVGSGIAIGAANGAGTNAFDGAIAELLVTAGPPIPAEIAAIEAYGVVRYGGSPFV